MVRVDVTARVRKFTDHVRGQEVRCQMLTDRLAAVSSEIESLGTAVEDLEKIHGVITLYAQLTQENFLQQVESVVTQGLQAVFEDAQMRFRMDQRVSGKRLEVKFYLTTGEGENTLETGIMDARGGGVAAVVGFLLRVALMLLTPTQRKLLILDEAFAQLSAEYLPNLSEFISQLTERTGIQVLMVTHSPELTADADVVYEVSQTAGETLLAR